MTTYEFLTEDEAAAELRFPNKRKLAQLRRTGKGPAYRRHGSTAVYTLEDLRAWSEKNRHENTTQEGLLRMRPNQVVLDKQAKQA